VGVHYSGSHYLSSFFLDKYVHIHWCAGADHYLTTNIIHKEEVRMPCTDQRREPTGDLSVWLESAIKEFCMDSPDNSLKNKENDRAFDKPLVGFSSGSEPLYRTIKEDIGPFYMTPIEVFEKSFPDAEPSADKLTVISWILPQAKVTRADNRKETTYPSERWARAKAYGEIVFNVMVRRHVVDILRDSGFKAVAPVLEPFWSWGVSERYSIASNWSERHAAYVSGLGTFGLCDGLITPIGKAMRCGSVIAEISVQPTRRPYTDHHEYCIHYAKETCGKCITRCPAGAISEKGHDKQLCHEYLMGITSPYVKTQF